MYAIKVRQVYIHVYIQTDTVNSLTLRRRQQVHKENISLCFLWDSGSETVLALQWHSIHALVLVCGHLCVLYHYTCAFRVLAYTILTFLTTVVAT